MAIGVLLRPVKAHATRKEQNFPRVPIFIPNASVFRILCSIYDSAAAYFIACHRIGEEDAVIVAGNRRHTTKPLILFNNPSCLGSRNFSDRAMCYVEVKIQPVRVLRFFLRLFFPHLVLPRFANVIESVSRLRVNVGAFAVCQFAVAIGDFHYHLPSQYLEAARSPTVAARMRLSSSVPMCLYFRVAPKGNDE